MMNVQVKTKPSATPLNRLHDYGQAVWLDFLSRRFIAEGNLKKLIEQDGLSGVTSNPSIFEKAIDGSTDYDAQIQPAVASEDCDAMALYERLAIEDIRHAADALRPVYDRTEGRDGYVSLEVSPYLATNTEATVVDARRLWKAVGRDNLMIKVPATKAGLPAIRQLTGEGINVNITLLFSQLVYEDVVEAYLAGLEDLVARGGDPRKVSSVASFFVSRIDVAVDKLIEERIRQTNDAGQRETLDRLRGKIAIANAKLAFQRYKRLFAGTRWEKLRTKGARVQRLLWASTGTKNKDYSDVLYVEELVAADTISTVPPATMDAFRDHGKVRASLEENIDQAKETMAALERSGISIEKVTDKLIEDGVQLFAEAFDKLLGAVTRKRAADLGEKLDSQTYKLSPDFEKMVAASLESWRQQGDVRRLWAGNAHLWTGTDEAKWLGWLNIVGEQQKRIAALSTLADDVQRAGLTHLLLLGMGGSSLGPEVLGETFGRQPGWPRFYMLDSTDPAQIQAIERVVNLGKTLFIVSSKSGSTLEPNIFLDYFFERVGAVRDKDKAGAHFIAVTDPGSPLERRANELRFTCVFHGAPSIGGRYSVLSKFGLVPAAAMGLDVRRLLETTRTMQRSCGADVPPSENPGVQLGVAMGVAATCFGRDKVTIIASPGIADFGAWLEQLLAESTGKQGGGLVPLAGEPLTVPEGYGNDRFFAYLELNGQVDPSQRQAVEALERAGHPVAKISVKDVWHIGQEFFRWEIATAVAASIIGIDPFNQPDLEASKDKTHALTDAYEKSQRLPEEQPVFRENGVALYADLRNASQLDRHNTLAGYLKSHFGRVHAGGKSGDYVALLAYIERNASHTRALTAMRTHIRDKTRAATCLGFGPRFQHSTGQAYKGGPNSGVFLQVTCDDPADIDVPGHSYSFGVVKAAQASGDLAVLVERDRRTLRVHLKHVDAGLEELSHAIDAALE
jgi:transaldolase / glucose-6-phosphate isomerase